MNSPIFGGCRMYVTKCLNMESWQVQCRNTTPCRQDSWFGMTVKRTDWVSHCCRTCFASSPVGFLWMADRRREAKNCPWEQHVDNFVQTVCTFDQSAKRAYKWQKVQSLHMVKFDNFYDLLSKTANSNHNAAFRHFFVFLLRVLPAQSNFSGVFFPRTPCAHWSTVRNMFSWSMFCPLVLGEFHRFAPDLSCLTGGSRQIRTNNNMFCFKLGNFELSIQNSIVEIKM